MMDVITMLILKVIHVIKGTPDFYVSLYYRAHSEWQ